MRLAALFLALGLLLSPARGADTLVPTGATWKYLDDGSDQGTAWRDPDFDDGPWASGPAQLGYGDDGEVTVVGFGPDPLDKFITTYFRHVFEVADPSIYATLELQLLRDDGAIVYLNGDEIFRSNMDSGPVDYLTTATTAVGAEEALWHAIYLDTSALVAGSNVLAVEVHQSSGFSSDISLDLSLEASEETERLEFAWAGALAPTSIRVNARTKFDSSAVRLHVGESPDLAGGRISELHTAELAVNNRVVSMPMPGLRPGTAYHYAVEVDGQLDLTKQGRFTTPVASPMTFTFAFASCAGTGSSHVVFDTIRDLDPLFFLHTGDFHYLSLGVDDVNAFRAAYDLVLASPTQAALYRSTPIAYMWDDHDYGPNNGDATAPGRTASRLTYQEYVPHYPLVAGSGDVPIYQAFSIGRVRFILTDGRSERTPYLDPDGPTKTMLGDAQKQWLKQELLAAQGVYPVIVWVNTLPWIGTTGDDGWYVYTYERHEIADFIDDHDIASVVMLSGDAHMLAIDDGTNSDYATGGGAGFPVMHAAALDRGGSVKGGPYSEGAFPGTGQFGLMTVHDDGVSPVCISWSGRNSANDEIVAWGICADSPPPVDTDGDGTGDVEDCSFADASTWGAPGAVTGVHVEPGPLPDVFLSWDSQDPGAGPSTSYAIVRGRISELHADGGFAQAACEVADQPDTPRVESAGPPPPGDGDWFLIRAVNSCGSGGFGQTGPDDPRFPLDGDAPCPLR